MTYCVSTILKVTSVYPESQLPLAAAVALITQAPIAEKEIVRVAELIVQPVVPADCTA
jgi:hypothetical protein